MQHIKKLMEQSMSVSRRNLHSIARNIGHKFAYSAEHIAALAYSNGIEIVRADILNLMFEIDLFNIERNIKLLEMCKRNLLRNMEAYKPFYLCSAKLMARFGIHEFYLKNGMNHIVKSSYEIELMDNEKRIWKGKYIKSDVFLAY